jgi:hypothetical protein
MSDCSRPFPMSPRRPPWFWWGHIRTAAGRGAGMRPCPPFWGGALLVAAQSSSLAWGMVTLSTGGAGGICDGRALLGDRDPIVFSYHGCRGHRPDQLGGEPGWLFGPFMIGFLRHRTGGFQAGLLVVSASSFDQRAGGAARQGRGEGIAGAEPVAQPMRAPAGARARVQPARALPSSFSQQLFTIGWP